MRIKKIFWTTVTRILKGIIGVFRILLSSILFIGTSLVSPILKKGVVPLYLQYLKHRRAVRQVIGVKKNAILAFLANRYLVHATMIGITSGVLLLNINTREALAEDISQTTLLARIFSQQEEEIIVEEREEGELTPVAEDTSLLVLRASQPSPSTLDSLPIRPQNGAAILKQESEQSPSGTVAKQPARKPAPRTSIETYIVKEGDTLSGIARSFGVSINTILWANNLSSRSLIRPGDKLTILPQDGVLHKVRRNETLSSIARTYGTTINEIQKANNIQNASLLSVGKTLVIPGGKPRPVAPRRSSIAAARNRQSVPPPSSAAASAKGFVWPTPGRKINQYFHLRHRGLDIDNVISDRDPIYAAADGRVEVAGWSNVGYGLYIIINHGNGIKTLYAHMSKLLVSRGQQVTQGQVIGIMGTTGRSTGVHLHYEIRVNNRTQNPFNFY